MRATKTFVALIGISGINPYVEVPEEIVEALGGNRARLRVRLAKAPKRGEAGRKPGPQGLASGDAEQLRAIGRLSEDGWFRTSLVPSKDGPTRLYLDGWMRAEAEVGVGDAVAIWLVEDRAARDLPLPAPLAEVLAVEPRALRAWEALAPSRRREILSYLNFLKTPAALDRNVQKTLDQLLEAKR